MADARERERLVQAKIENARSEEQDAKTAYEQARQALSNTSTAADKRRVADLKRKMEGKKRSVDNARRESTRAAAKMLGQNYRMLDNWPLAITGYNHGPYGVKRAVKKVGSTNLVYLIEHYKKDTWGFASKNFYAEFLAAVSILTDHQVNKSPVKKQETAATSPSPDSPL